MEFFEWQGDEECIRISMSGNTGLFYSVKSVFVYGLRALGIVITPCKWQLLHEW